MIKGVYRRFDVVRSFVTVAWMVTVGSRRFDCRMFLLNCGMKCQNRFSQIWPSYVLVKLWHELQIGFITDLTNVCSCKTVVNWQIGFITDLTGVCSYFENTLRVLVEAQTSLQSELMAQYYFSAACRDVVISGAKTFNLFALYRQTPWF